MRDPPPFSISRVNLDGSPGDVKHGLSGARPFSEGCAALVGGAGQQRPKGTTPVLRVSGPVDRRQRPPWLGVEVHQDEVGPRNHALGGHVHDVENPVG